MTPSEIARAMGEYIREHGFSPLYHAGNGCGCFMHAYSAITAIEFQGSDVRKALRDVVGTSFGEWDLKQSGWLAGHTDDASAACDIAADLLS